MASNNLRLRAAFSQLDLSKKDKDYLLPAVLGFLIQGKETVEVGGRAGFVYARLRSNLNELVQAYNDKVSPVYDLPVLLQRDPTNPTRYRVEGRDVGRYSDWGNISSYLPKHGNQHSFNPEGGGGGDTTWIYSQQIVPWLVSPSGTNGSAGVIVHGHPHFTNGQWAYWGGTGTSSILAYKPTDAQAKLVLVSLDDYGNPFLVAGSSFSALYTGTNSILPYIPQSTGTPLAAIRLVSGTSSIVWPNIYDVRPFFSGGGGTNSSAGHTIQDDGVNQTARTNLNFVGSAFSVYDDPANSSTNVSGTSGNADTLDTYHASDLVGQKIKVWDNSAATVRFYDATEAGFFLAIAGLETSDRIYLPATTITLSSGVTLPASVYMSGEGMMDTFLYNFSGGTLLTMGSSCILNNLRINVEGTYATNSIAVSAGTNCFIENVYLYSYNSSSSGTSYALYNGGTTTCLLARLANEQGSNGYVIPYNTRPRGFWYQNATSSLYRHISSSARYGTDTDYIDLSSYGVYASGTAGIHVRYSAFDSSNPPTIADLNAAFGSAAVVGAGFTGLLNDNGGGTNEYLCTSDGAKWFYVTLTAAA